MKKITFHIKIIMKLSNTDLKITNCECKEF